MVCWLVVLSVCRFVGVLACTLWLNSVSRISFLLPLLLTLAQVVSGYSDLEVSQWLVVLAREVRLRRHRVIGVARHRHRSFSPSSSLSVVVVIASSS